MDVRIFIAVLVIYSALAVLLLGKFVRCLNEERRANTTETPLRPGVRFTGYYAGMFGFLFAIAALMSAAAIAAQQEGLWKVVPLLLINLVIQPVCLMSLAICLHRLRHAIFGRFTYGFRVISSEEFPLWLLIPQTIGTIFWTLLACGMSYSCLQPLL